MTASAIVRNKSSSSTRWKDNVVVTVANGPHLSMAVSHLALQTDGVQLTRKRKKSAFLMPSKCTIEIWVGQIEHNMNKHRISIGSKKWWWSLFTWMLNVAVIMLDNCQKDKVTY